MTEKTKTSRLDRAQFLGISWLVGLLAFVGEGIAATFKFLEPNTEGEFGGVIVAGKVDEFLPGTVSQIKAGRFYLQRYEDGRFLALWQQCTHLGCSVPWEEESSEFRCPCHGSVFNDKGEVLGGPAPRPLDIFPVTIQDGLVLVDTGKPLTRKQFDINQTTQA